MKQFQMTQHVTTLSVLASLGLLAACASDGDKAVGTGGATSTGGAPGTSGASNMGGAESTSGGSDAGDDSGVDPNCASGNGFLCSYDLKGMPFVAFTVSYSDYCGVCSGGSPPAGKTTETMSQPESGEVCLSGRVSPGGLAGFNIVFGKRNLDGTKVLEPFDAASRSITQMEFTIVTPPSTGLNIGITSVAQLDCPGDPLACGSPVFVIVNGAVLGPVVVSFANLKTADNSALVLDTSKLDAMFIQNYQTGDYNFCIRDLKFFDAQGNVVEP